MKRTVLVSLLEKAGFKFLRNGGNHDIYVRDGIIVPVPRHKEINERLAKSIIKKYGLK